MIPKKLSVKNLSKNHLLFSLLLPLFGLVFLASIAAPAEAVTLGISGDKFTIDQNKTFLLGVSAFDAVGKIQDSDLDRLVQYKYNLIRIWLYWRDLNVAYDSNGNLLADKKAQLIDLVDRANARGIVVDVTLLYLYEGSSYPSFGTNIEKMKTAVKAVATALKDKKNVLFDIMNEHDNTGNGNPSGQSHETIGILRNEIKNIDPQRILTVSSTQKHLINPPADSVVTENVNAEISTVKVDVLTPHLPRPDKTSDWYSRTGARVTSLQKYTSLPIYLQEETPFEDDPVADHFVTAVDQAKTSGAAGWIFHQRSGFDLAAGSLWNTLGSGGQDALIKISQKINGGSSCTPGNSCTTSANCPGTYDNSCACVDVTGDNCPSSETWSPASASDYKEYPIPQAGLSKGSIEFTVTNLDNSTSNMPEKSYSLAIVLDKATVSTASEVSANPNYAGLIVYGHNSGGTDTSGIIKYRANINNTCNDYSCHPADDGQAGKRCSDDTDSPTDTCPMAWENYENFPYLPWENKTHRFRIEWGAGSNNSHLIYSYKNGNNWVVLKDWDPGQISKQQYHNFTWGQNTVLRLGNSTIYNSIPRVTYSDIVIKTGDNATDTTPPNPPTNLTSPSQTNTTINLSWTASSAASDGDLASSYVVKRNGSQITTTTSTTYTDTGLSTGTSYPYSIFAVDDAGNTSTSSANGTFTTATGGGSSDITPPNPPTNLTSPSQTTTTINLRWTASSAASDGDLASYYVVKRNGSQITTTTSTTYTDTGLSSESVYSYSISAVDDAGNTSTSSANGTFKTATDELGGNPPATPTNLSATAISSSQINLTWTDNSDDETGFIIEYSTNQNGPYAQAGTTSANSKSFQSTGLSSDTTYYFRVKAYNDAGESNYSNIVNAKTLTGGGTGDRTVTFSPTADAYTRQDNPTLNYGSENELWEDVSDAQNTELIRSYLKFNITGVSSQIQKAEIYLYCTNHGFGSELYPVSDTTWQENAITWNNQPPLGTTRLDIEQEAFIGQWYSFDVTSAMTGNGTYSFALKHIVFDGIHWASKEYGTPNLRPYIKITYTPDGDVPPTCPNDILDPGEQCDGSVPSGVTCTTQMGSGYTGTITCNQDCTYNTSGCKSGQTSNCPNGVINPGEQCDGSVPAGVTCTTQMGSGYTGTITCNQDCTYNTSGCKSGQTSNCPNGVINPGEQCDGSVPSGVTCATQLGAGYTGRVTCDQNCTFNTSNCQLEPGSGSCDPIVISNISVSTGKTYVQACIKEGNEQFIDRSGNLSIKITDIPADYENLRWIKTANDDKQLGAPTNFLSYDINQDAMVYVGYDKRITTLPSWLSGWTNTGSVITDSQPAGKGTYRIFSKKFIRGRVILGANSSNTDSSNMYIVLNKGLGTITDPICGNGEVEYPEGCDDRNTDPGDGCSATCQVETTNPHCGNSIVETGETCDDGNTLSGDGCSADCQDENPNPVCGNGRTESGENCDDSNTISGDGCSSTCQREGGQVCGDNIIEGDENCEDGNVYDGDGCSSSCHLEQPDFCSATGNYVCGNDIVEPGENCDDKNTQNGDGCSDTCQVENPTCGDSRCTSGETKENCSQDCTPSDAGFAWCNDDRTLCKIGTNGRAPAIVMDHKGNMHLAYNCGVGYNGSYYPDWDAKVGGATKICYRKWDCKEGLSSEQVIGSGSYGWIAIDHNNLPHVIWTGGGIKYNHKDANGKWIGGQNGILLVKEDLRLDKGRIAINSKNQVFVSFTDASSSGWKVAYVTFDATTGPNQSANKNCLTTVNPCFESASSSHTIHTGSKLSNGGISIDGDDDVHFLWTRFDDNVGMWYAKLNAATGQLSAPVNSGSGYSSNFSDIAAEPFGNRIYGAAEMAWGSGLEYIWGDNEIIPGSVANILTNTPNEVGPAAIDGDYLQTEMVVDPKNVPYLVWTGYRNKSDNQNSMGMFLCDETGTDGPNGAGYKDLVPQCGGTYCVSEDCVDMRWPINYYVTLDLYSGAITKGPLPVVSESDPVGAGAAKMSTKSRQGSKWTNAKASYANNGGIIVAFEYSTPKAPDDSNSPYDIYIKMIDGANVCAQPGYIPIKPIIPTGQEALNPPTGLAGTVSGSGQIQLTWNDTNTTEIGYYLERIKQGQDWGNAVVITLAANSSSYTDSGLESNTSYSYRVRAFDACGQSDYSASITVKTTGITLNEPTNLVAAAIHSNQINLSWADNNSGENNENGFSIERAPGDISDPNSQTWALLTQVGANVTSYSDVFTDTLSTDMTYSYRVKAYKTGSESGYSNIEKATRLRAPSNLSATPISSSQINLTWVDNSNSESNFLIERATGNITDPNSTAWALIASVSAGTFSYTNAGLTQATTYSYRVRAFKTPDDNSSFSNIVVATTLSETPPSAPTGLEATATSYDSIYLHWTDTSLNEKGFRIERVSGGKTSLITVGVNTVSLTDSGLEPDTEYTYRVQAYNDAGASAYAGPATARTKVRTNKWSLVASPSTVGVLDQIIVRWTAPQGETTSDDWIAMYEVGAFEYEWVTSRDVTGVEQGSVAFSPPASPGYWEPGEYFFVYYQGTGVGKIGVTSASITINP